VVDLQYLYHCDYGAGARLRQLGTFETHGYMYDRDDATVVPNVQRLLAACRQEGVHVFYTRNASTGWECHRRPRRRRTFATPQEEMDVLATPNSRDTSALPFRRPIPTASAS
jgi:nicotinamidase-related amidase